MKIVEIDNFDRETVSDVLVCENVNDYYGHEIVKALNGAFSGPDSDIFYVLKPDDYKLFIFSP